MYNIQYSIKHVLYLRIRTKCIYSIKQLIVYASKPYEIIFYRYLLLLLCTFYNNLYAIRIDLFKEKYTTKLECNDQILGFKF